MKFGRYVAAAGVLLALAVPAQAQGRNGAVSDTMQLLRYPEVRKELALTKTQMDQISKLQGGLKTRLMSALQGMKALPAKERPKQFQSFRDGVDREVVQILDVKQRKRLRELQLQKEGVRALTKPTFAAELRVNAAQTYKMNSAVANERDDLRKLLKDASKKQPLSEADKKKIRGEVEERRKVTDGQLLKVLTVDQQAKFKTLQGAPFTFPDPGAAAFRMSPAPASSGPRPVVPPPPGTPVKPKAKPAVPAKK